MKTNTLQDKLDQLQKLYDAECDRSEAIRHQLQIAKNDYKVGYEIIEGYRAQTRALIQAGKNTNAAFCEWAPPEVRAPYFAAWDAAEANAHIPTTVTLGEKRAYLTNDGKAVVRSALPNTKISHAP